MQFEITVGYFEGVELTDTQQQIIPYQSCFQFGKFVGVGFQKVIEILTAFLVFCYDVVAGLGLKEIHELYDLLYLMPFL